MKVILLEQIKRLGNVGDIARVRDGYARNFLIPNKKVLRATKENIAYFESKKSEIEKEASQKVAEAEKLASKIKGVVIDIIRQAGEDGRLYGSVNASDIATALTEKTKEQIDRKQVVLNNPIKYIGIYKIEIHIYANIYTTIHPNVSRNGDDAKEAAKRFARGEMVMEGPDGENHKEEQETAKKQKPVKEKPKVKKETGEVKQEENKKVIPKKSKSDTKKPESKKEAAKPAAKKEMKVATKKPAVKKSVKVATKKPAKTAKKEAKPKKKK